jgi:hypothetical protein
MGGKKFVKRRLSHEKQVELHVWHQKLKALGSKKSKAYELGLTKSGLNFYLNNPPEDRSQS